VVFPHAKPEPLMIRSGRGRILMFQNYGQDRPAVHPAALHYGSYCDSRPKRLLALGALTNENPVTLAAPRLHACSPLKATPGWIYCPNTDAKAAGRKCDYIGHHHEEHTYQYGVGALVNLKCPEHASDDFLAIDLVEAEVIRREAPDEKVCYAVVFRSNMLNNYLNIAGSTQKQIPEEQLSLCCGRLSEEMLVFILLKELGMSPIVCAGWLCRCHLCRPLACSGVGLGCACRLCTAVHPQRKAMAVLWERGALFDGCDRLVARCHRVADAFATPVGFAAPPICSEPLAAGPAVSCPYSTSALRGTLGMPSKRHTRCTTELALFDGCRCPDCLLRTRRMAQRCDEERPEAASQRQKARVMRSLDLLPDLSSDERTVQCTSSFLNWKCTLSFLDWKCRAVLSSTT